MPTGADFPWGAFQSSFHLLSSFNLSVALLTSSYSCLERLFVNPSMGPPGALSCTSHCAHLHHAFRNGDGKDTCFYPTPSYLNTQQQALGGIITLILKAVFRNEEEQERDKSEKVKAVNVKLLDERRKAVRHITIGIAQVGLKGIFRQLENTFSSIGQREEVNSRYCCVNKSNLGERRVGMFHYGFLEAILCRLKWVMESDI